MFITTLYTQPAGRAPINMRTNTLLFYRPLIEALAQLPGMCDKTGQWPRKPAKFQNSKICPFQKKYTPIMPIKLKYIKVTSYIFN